MSSHAARILVVEDDPDIRRFLRIALESEGHAVSEAGGVQRGLVEAGLRPPDLVMLDLGLPDGDGIALLHELRAWCSAPVLVLSARGGESEKVRALDAGADDYLVKPFGPAELLARTRAHLRRRLHRTGADEPVLAFGDVQVDRAQRRVLKGGEPLHLTPLEYRLLLALGEWPERVLTHRHLLQALWGPSHADDTHVLRVHMGNLRRKIEPDPAQPRFLRTETGVGYRFTPSGG